MRRNNNSQKEYINYSILLEKGMTFLRLRWELRKTYCQRQGGAFWSLIHFCMPAPKQK